MMAVLLKMAVVGLGGAVLVASACRVNKIQLQQHRAGWVLAYVLMWLYAALEIHDALVIEPRFSALVGLAAIALWIWGSRATWANGAPTHLRRRT